MFKVEGSNPGKHFPDTQSVPQVNFSQARAAYKEATDNPEECHAQVGILSVNGAVTFEKLGKPEEYGAHRVGSVTKTFTTFLAMKLAQEGILPHGLKTKCSDVIDPQILIQVFEDPIAAGDMTLEQLLSHTAGLELDDHSRPQDTVASTLQERFLQESKAKEGRKFLHICKPGDTLASYSNAGAAVAGWMMEAAYNKKHPEELLSFAQIMKKELFEEVFDLSESYIAPGNTGDIIQSPAGDMTSSTSDLMKVAVKLHDGDPSIEKAFGSNWRSVMLKPRDIFQGHGLGCTANAPVIRHAGMNREQFGSKEVDVTALVEFPLHPGEPGLVAMCDSCALGPALREQRFIHALEITAGISKNEEIHPESVYDLHFFCPPNAHLFHGNAYLATDVDPFTKDAPKTIICSRNGMKHELKREEGIDNEKQGIRGYKDENGKPWLCIMKDDGRNMIYSDLCLVTRELDLVDLASKQPSLSSIQALQGVYADSENPDEHPVYTFYEEKGQLYMKEGNEDGFPCLYIPDEHGGSWAMSNPTGRTIKIQFPDDPDKDSLVITDIFTGVQQLPHNSKRK